MRSPFRRRRDAQEIARLNGENAALRRALADLGRQLHAAQADALGNTVPMPRSRSAAAPRWEAGQPGAWPPKEWTR